MEPLKGAQQKLQRLAACLMSSKHDRRLSAILNKAVQTQNAKLLVRGLKYEIQFSWSDFDARQQIKEPPVTERLQPQCRSHY